MLKNAGVYTETRYPTNDDLLEAEKFYLGGHRTEIDQEEYDDLTAAGYSDYLETE